MQKKDAIIRRLEGKNLNTHNDFSFRGNLNGKSCLFKMDTGSDVSVVKCEIGSSFKAKTGKIL